jgi:hypothetical protein
MEVPNIRFQVNPSSGSRTDLCRQTDMTKVNGAFRDYANGPNNVSKQAP